MRSGLVATDVGCRSKSTVALSLGALAALGNGQKSESACGKARGGGGLRPLTGNRCPLYPQTKADMVQHNRDVRFVPKADIGHLIRALYRRGRSRTSRWSN